MHLLIMRKLRNEDDSKLENAETRTTIFNQILLIY